MSGLRYMVHKVFRRKTLTDDFLDTQLDRCLSTFDIAVLGMGHMLGAGIYVMTGQVAHASAGPAIVLSFVLAALASLLAALCYAEFGARVPKAGSAYTYTYVTLGEIWAFIIGWSIILEHMLCAAAVGRAWSGYLDSLLGHVIRNGTVDYIGRFHGAFMDYPDFIAFFVVVIFAMIISSGVKKSTLFNNVFTVINLIVIAFVTIYGFTFADSANWRLPATSEDKGGFMPFGFGGVMAGAASCFFAYIGFDGIATSGEEAANPRKSIPLATMIAMTAVTTCYVVMSAALTLMVPFRSIHTTSAFADAFSQRGVVWAKYVVAVGALAGMTTSLVGSLFALPRCVYAMAEDGLIFRFLAQIHPKTQVPTLAAIGFGLISAVIALLFDIQSLVQFLSIGTLLAYTMISSSVIILRYKPMVVVKGAADLQSPKEDTASSGDTAGLISDEANTGRLKPRFQRLYPFFGSFEPGNLVCFAVFGLNISVLGFAASTTYAGVDEGTWYGVLLTVVFLLLIGCCLALIGVHEQSRSSLTFKVPFVPIIPMLSILINICLMLHLATVTWVRLFVWLAFGLCIYFIYGVTNSTEANVMTREYSNLVADGAKNAGSPPAAAAPADQTNTK